MIEDLIDGRQKFGTQTLSLIFVPIATIPKILLCFGSDN
jgi:hypothetical protein